jgi:hypothetical protein
MRELTVGQTIDSGEAVANLRSQVRKQAVSRPASRPTPSTPDARPQRWPSWTRSGPTPAPTPTRARASSRRQAHRPCATPTTGARQTWLYAYVVWVVTGTSLESTLGLLLAQVDGPLLRY